jgi:hypothetical protein
MDQFSNDQSRNTSYQLITNPGSFSLQTLNKIEPPPHICPPPMSSPYNRKECDSGDFTNIPDELVLYIVKDFDCLNIRTLTLICKRFLVIIRPEWSLIHRNSPPILDYRKNFNCKKLKKFLNEEQIPYTLRIYSVGSSLMNLPDDGKEYVSEGFTKFPLDIIRYIANCLDALDIRALKQVSRRIFAIMRREWPPILFYVALWSNGMIEDSQERDLYNFGTKLYKKRATNNSMDPMCHFEGIMNQYPPHKMVIDPSRWTSMRLKGGTDNHHLNQSWTDYLKECVNLVHLELIDTSDIHLESVNFKRLERFFMKYKPVNEWIASITLPSSMKATVVYASKGNDQEYHTQPSKRYVNRLDPGTLECMQFELW